MALRVRRRGGKLPPFVLGKLESGLQLLERPAGQNPEPVARVAMHGDRCRIHMPPLRRSRARNEHWPDQRRRRRRRIEIVPEILPLLTQRLHARGADRYRALLPPFAQRPPPPASR